MTNAVNFNGAVMLAPKVEKAIREQEFFALQKIFKNTPEDVFVKSREVMKTTKEATETFFECYANKTKKVLSQLVSIPKN